MMRKKQRAHKIQCLLDKYFPDTLIPLKHQDPYTLLIAVLLSAQCTDERVNQVTPRLFKKACTPFTMSKLSVENILGYIRSCGLGPKKAKAIYELSNILCTKYQGEVPRSLEALESLPGVGHKTASVVISQAFGVPAFPVDTHIHRCAHRWKLSNGHSVKQTEKDLKVLFPKKNWNKLHLQIIYFARAFCPARNHAIEVCPICSWI